MTRFTKFNWLYAIIVASLFFATGCKNPTDPEDSEVGQVLEFDWSDIVFLDAKPKSLEGVPEIDLSFLDSISFGKRTDMFQSSVYDLSSEMPPVGDQDSIGSCASWAVGYAINSYLQKRKNKQTHYTNVNLFSPSFIHNYIRVCKEKKCGGWPTDAFMVLQTYGVCDIAAKPYSWEECNTEPTQQQIQSAAQNKIAYWGRIQFSGIKKCISSGLPVVVTIGAYTGKGAFLKPVKEKIDNEIKYVWSNNSGDLKGTHVVVIVGYDDNNQLFKIQNSYGIKYGSNGFVYVKYDVLEKSIAVDEIYRPCILIGYYAKSPDDPNDPDPSGDPNLQVTQTSINFANTIINQTTIKTVDVKNTGVADLIVNASSNTAEFTCDWTTATVKPNETKKLTITFKPTQTKSYNSTITITGTNTGQSVEIKCAGIGINNPNEDVDLNAGLVAYYPFDGDAKDYSGLGNHGVNYGAELTTGRKGQAYKFDGSNYVHIVNNTLGEIGDGDFTLSLWYRISTLPTEPYILYHGNYNYSTLYGMNTYVSLTSTSHQWQKAGGGIGLSYVTETNQKPIVNSFTHIVVTINGNEVKFYLNGELVATGTKGHTYYCHNITLGCNSFVGSIDDVRIYNRALNMSEVEALYKE